MNDIQEKACKKCQKVKPAENFYENKYSPDGRYAFCKVCFDQFAQKLKENKPVPLNKTCKKCSKPKPLNAFDMHPDNSDVKDDWCKECRWATAQLKKLKAEKSDKKESDLLASKIKQPKPVDLPITENKPQEPKHNPVQKTIPEPAQKPLPELSDKTLPEHPQQNPENKQIHDQTDDFDFIEHLLDTQALEKKLLHETLQIPKQITKIKSRKRICNGCGKIEEIDQVEKNTVIPVHAWFCNFCQQRGARRWLKRGMTVQDYWGREFKIKKIISNDLVMGVVKNQNGKWDKKPLKIYGNWKIS
jgi:hypothetical protein